MFQHILVLWDSSELSERAFAIASDLGGVYGAELTAVCVVRAPDSRRRASRRHRLEPHSGHPLASADHAQALFTERHVGNPTESCPCQFRVIYGHDVVADLLHLAQEHGSDLVVVGHHASHAPHHLLPHGLTERLMSAARLPVLVVGAAETG